MRNLYSRVLRRRRAAWCLAAAAILLLLLKLVSYDRTLGPLPIGFCAVALRNGNFGVTFPVEGTFHWNHWTHSDIPLLRPHLLPGIAWRHTYSEETPTATPAVVQKAWFSTLIVPVTLPFLLGVIGAVLLIRPPRGRVAARPCPKCGYDLTGNVSGVCPECGGPLNPA